MDKAQPKVSPRERENNKAASHHEELGDFSTTLRVLPISALATVICAFVALALLRLIGLFTNLFYFGHWGAALRKHLRDLVRRDTVEALPNEPLRSVVYRMAEKRVTRMPVVETGTRKFLGLVSLYDLLKARARHGGRAAARASLEFAVFPAQKRSTRPDRDADSAVKFFIASKLHRT